MLPIKKMVLRENVNDADDVAYLISAVLQQSWGLWLQNARSPLAISQGFGTTGKSCVRQS